jgi:hypothetical protein
VIPDERVAPRVAGLLFKFFEQHSELGRVEVVHCKPLMDGSLESVHHSAKAVVQLVLNLGEPGVKAL